jgi:hypothetical protein
VCGVRGPSTASWLPLLKNPSLIQASINSTAQ